MEFNEFTKKIRKELKPLCEETAELLVNEVEKNNGCKMVGILCREDGRACTPIIYLEPYYERYCSGEWSLQDIVLDIKNIMDNGIEMENLRDRLFDYGSVKSHIMYRLVNMAMNRERLEQVPYIEYLDLAVIFYIKMADKQDGYFSTLIENKLVEKWGITEKELYAVAMENMQRQFPGMIERLDDVILRMSHGILENNICESAEQSILDMKSPLYIVTNEKGLWGASAILYPDLLKKLSDVVQADLILISSSIHEILVWPDRGQMDMKERKEIVRVINQNDVHAEEVLSYNLYQYRRDRDCVESVTEV